MHRNYRYWIQAADLILFCAGMALGVVVAATHFVNLLLLRLPLPPSVLFMCALSFFILAFLITEKGAFALFTLLNNAINRR